MKKSEKLLDAIGQIDEKWIAEAAENEKKRAGSKKTAMVLCWQSALAACALLAVCVGVFGLLHRNGLLMGSSGKSDGDYAAQPEAVMEAAPQAAAGEAAQPAEAGRPADIREAGRSADMPEAAKAGRTDSDGNEAAAAQKEDLHKAAEEENAQAEDAPAAAAQITLRVVESSGKGITCALENQSDVPVTYGNAFYLEQRKDGIWQEVALQAEVFREDIAYVLEPGGSREVTVDWSSSYGELPAGEYRFVRPAAVEGDGESGSITLIAEFSVE